MWFQDPEFQPEGRSLLPEGRPALVSPLVRQQMTTSSEPFAARLTGVRSLARVRPGAARHVPAAAEPYAAGLAGVRLLAGVNSAAVVQVPVLT